MDDEITIPLMGSEWTSFGGQFKYQTEIILRFAVLTASIATSTPVAGVATNVCSSDDSSTSVLPFTDIPEKSEATPSTDALMELSEEETLVLLSP